MRYGKPVGASDGCGTAALVARIAVMERAPTRDQEEFVKQIEATIVALSCDETFKQTAARRATRDNAIANLQAVVDLYRTTALCPTCGGGGRVPKKG